MDRRRPFLCALIAAGVATACSDAGGPGGAATHLGFQTQPAASIPLDPIAGPVRVAVLDADGDVVRGSSALVTLALGVNPTGSVIIGLASVHAVNGVAEFRTAALSAPGSGYTLVASAVGLAGATSTAFNVTPATPSSMAFQTQPAGSVKDSVINPGSIRVSLLDENGDVLTGGDRTVQIALGANPGGATLTGISSLVSVNGIATFSNLKLNALGTGYTLVAQSAGVPAVTSSAFDVTLSLADSDEDGFSPNSGDCNDHDANVRPNMPDDLPDPSFVDANCDGIDGNVSKAVFAAPQGADNAACGTQVAPCRNVSFAIQRATALGKRDVYLFEGGYDGLVTLADGVSIYGGYFNVCPNDVCVQFWQRHANGIGSSMRGGFINNVGPGEPQAVTMYGSNLTTPATIADVLIYAPPFNITDNLTTAAGRGRNTYGVILRDVAPGVVAFERVGIVAGGGYWGLDGTNGGSAPVTPAMDGSAGGSGDAPAGCNDTSRGTAGAGGTSAIAGANGGAGGRGGAKDTDCNPASLNLSAQAGEAGQNADAFQLGVFGTGGAFGPGSEVPCTVGPSNGLPGRVANGDRGPAISAHGFLENEFWAGFSGSPGGLGLDGTGGGGGGGAGACGDAYGAGGGGGGAGGSRAETPSAGGRGGGGSFGLYLINASPTIRNSSIYRAEGGKGGVGGIGGRGQSGGQGGASGTGLGGLSGGAGANGAHGGHGAGGGGGGGGISVGIFRSSAASVPVLTSVVFSGGGGGGAGDGGASAPTAPIGERDGVAGRDGPFGVIFDVFLCTASTGC